MCLVCFIFNLKSFVFDTGICLEIVRGKAQGKKKKRIDAIFSELRKMFITDKKRYS